MKTNYKCLRGFRRPLYVALGLIGLSLLPALPALARTYTVTSPDVHHTWSWGMIDNRQFYSDHGMLKAEVTFTTAPYASHDVANQSESKDFAFPGVTYDAKSGYYMARLSNGRTVPVAQKVNDILFSDIHLLPGNSMRVYRDSDAVVVALKIHSV